MRDQNGIAQGQPLSPQIYGHRESPKSIRREAQTIDPEFF